MKFIEIWHVVYKYYVLHFFFFEVCQISTCCGIINSRNFLSGHLGFGRHHEFTSLKPTHNGEVYLLPEVSVEKIDVSSHWNDWVADKSIFRFFCFFPHTDTRAVTQKFIVIKRCNSTGILPIKFRHGFVIWEWLKVLPSWFYWLLILQIITKDKNCMNFKVP